MKVLLLAQFLPPVLGGAQRHVWTLARALAARAHEVTLLGFAHVLTMGYAVVRRTRSALRAPTNDVSSSTVSMEGFR
jgi:Glycosyltransferase Family 4